MALFEVYQNGKAVMSTEYAECIYPLRILLSIKACGYTFKYNGKRYTPKRGGEELYQPAPKARRV